MTFDIKTHDVIYLFIYWFVFGMWEKKKVCILVMR